MQRGTEESCDREAGSKGQDQGMGEVARIGRQQRDRVGGCRYDVLMSQKVKGVWPQG